MKVGSLFTGIGGFDLGFQWAGYDITWQVEIDNFATKVLEKNFPNVKRYKDIKEVNPNELEEVDVVCGGFPCQPFSIAGQRRGKEDDRYLWPEMFRIIKGKHPRWVIVENVAHFANMALEDTVFDLEKEGYEVWIYNIPAVAVNAPHERKRIFIIAHSNSIGSSGRSKVAEQILGSEITKNKTKGSNSEAWTSSNTTNSYAIAQKQGNSGEQNVQQKRSGFQPNTTRQNTSNIQVTANSNNWRQAFQKLEATGSKQQNRWSESWIEVATRLCRVDDGISSRLDECVFSKAKLRNLRLKALGNAVVPQIVYIFASGIKEVDKMIREE